MTTSSFRLPVLARLVLCGAFAGATGHPALAQQAPTLAGQAIYTTVQQPAQLPSGGGAAAVLAAVQQRLVYPARALRDGVAGRSFARLTVDREGSIVEVKIVRSLRSDCDSAAVAAVQQLPRLLPARMGSRAVYYSFTLPITFQLPPATH